MRELSPDELEAFFDDADAGVDVGGPGAGAPRRAPAAAGPSRAPEPLFLPSPSASPQRPPPARRRSPSSEFDAGSDGISLDESALAEIAAAEIAALSGSSTFASSGPLAAGAGARSGPARPVDVIMLDESGDEDDMEDKENMPMPVQDRRVRRRVVEENDDVPPIMRARGRVGASQTTTGAHARARSTTMTDDVIDLSD
jgi:hypothetical protein